MDIDKDLLRPEGFSELYNYLKQRGLNEKVEVKEIQKSLSLNYGFTEGKITGIIKRAENSGLITNIKWGVYKFNFPSNKVDVLSEIDNEVAIAIDKIEKIIGKSFSVLETDEIMKVKEKIEILKKAIELK